MKTHLLIISYLCVSFSAIGQTLSIEPTDSQYNSTAPPQEKSNGGGSGIGYKVMYRNSSTNDEISYTPTNCRFTWALTKGKRYDNDATIYTVVGYPTIAVQWENTIQQGKLEVTVTNSGGTCPLVDNVSTSRTVNIRYIGPANAIQLNSSTVSGSNSVFNCGSSPVTFSTTAVQTQFPANGPVYYQWSVPSGWTINSGQGSPSVTVTPSLNTGGVVKFEARRTDQGTIKQSTAHTLSRNNPTTPVINSADIVACSPQTITASANNATSYNWATTGGASIISSSGNSATVTGTSDGTVYVSAYSSACNQSSSNSNSINIYAGAPTSDITIKDDYGQNAPNSMSCGYGTTCYSPQSYQLRMDV